MKTKTPSILPVVVVALLAGGLTFFFLLSLRADTDVVVAARPIGVGARLTAADLTLKKIRSADALTGTLTSIDAAVGQVISVQRLVGDQVTAAMLGSQALSAIASGLAQDQRAVAVTVSRSAGLAGVIRPGDRVTLIGILEPPNSTSAGGLALPAPAMTQTAPAALLPPGLEPTPQPTALRPTTPFARVTATGLKVLLVPQSFRYEEVTTTDSAGFAAAQSSQVGQAEGVILLEVPSTPLTVKSGDTTLTLTLPELIALLDTRAKVYLALEPPGAPAAAGPGVAIEQLVDRGVGGQP